MIPYWPAESTIYCNRHLCWKHIIDTKGTHCAFKDADVAQVLSLMTRFSLKARRLQYISNTLPNVLHHNATTTIQDLVRLCTVDMNKPKVKIKGTKTIQSRKLLRQQCKLPQSPISIIDERFLLHDDDSRLSACSCGSSKKNTSIYIAKTI